ARSAGVGLVSLCGGEGWCASCLVRLVKGKLSPLTYYEEAELEPQSIAQGYRLACQAKPLSDVKIEIPPASLSTPQRLQVEGQEQEVTPEPAVNAIEVSCPPPTLRDLRSDATRLLAAAEGAGRAAVKIGMDTLTNLSPQLRRNQWRARLALRGDQLVTILPSASRIYGLAADIGTTKLAVYLVDLESGETVEKTGAMNPQIAYGEDVMSRIAFTREHADGRRTLQTALVDTFNAILAEMRQRQGIARVQVVDAVCVGNTVMHHLFAGLPVEQLGLSPCVPAASEALDVPAGGLGLEIAPDAAIHLLPNIAGYVGADHVAMLLATRLWQKPGVAVGVDIGTNTEISLVCRGEMFSCSAASGPAFEGAHIRNGMRAAAGAIERVQIIDGQVRLYTIENQPPVGICGSGILDAVAEMRAAGVIDAKGALQNGHALVRPGKTMPEFLLAPAERSGHEKDIAITRKDINEIQLAKSAIRVGIDILLAQAGVQGDDIEEFIIAGAFGSYINVASAVKIGMFPGLPLERFRQVGNAAGIGARQALISTRQRRLAAEIAGRARYVELSGHPEFQRRFLAQMYL
ncbi:MAG: ASKHA domain-containing protein, partial [Chloroflexi bacterium]|nr:ASKHA domain-containing protein [Chloroflexota bacterium]